MKRATSWVVVAAVAVALAGACRVQGKRQQYEVVGDQATALRAAFNEDAGKVRVVMLVAPS
jgi:hypothetical protein